MSEAEPGRPGGVDEGPADRREAERGTVMPIWKRGMKQRAAPLPTRRDEPDLDEAETFLPEQPSRRQALEDLGRLPPLPRVRRRRSRGLLLSFVLCVLLPTVGAGIYYFSIAADQYVAEFRFAVTESSPMLPGVPPTTGSAAAATSSPLLGGLAAMVGGSSASLQNYVVIDYLLSRQAVDELERRIGVRALYSGPQSAGDPLARFDNGASMEKFVAYWRRMVSATYDPMTGLANANVRAFTPQDARLIADTLVAMSEELVNDIARRPQLDTVRFAEGEVRRAEQRMKDVRSALTEFRYREGIIDPSAPVSGNVDLVKALRGQLIQLQTELASLASQQGNTNAPMAQALRARITATRDQLSKVEKDVAQNRDGNRALTEVVGRYEQLDLERQYAQAMVVSTMQALDQARANASAQHLYLTPYVRPAQPESATYPRRGESTLLAALAAFGVWIVGFMIVRSIGEHL
jgi:capsular polysaccharide transport system permease protein